MSGVYGFGPSGSRTGIRPEARRVLLKCLFETGELFPYALLLLFLGFDFYLVAGMTHHLKFRPSAVDVASRLDLLSIDPDKWTPRSDSSDQTNRVS
jgi:hypothetical protein